MHDDIDHFELDRIGGADDCPCRILAHGDCDPAECEVQGRLSEIAAAEVRIITVGSYAAIALAVLMAPALLYMHFYAHLKGMPYPIPREFWVITLGPSAVLSAVVTWLKVRRKLPGLRNKP